MKEATRKEIIRLWNEGASRRQIRRRLGIPRHSVVRMLADHDNRSTAIADRERRRPNPAHHCEMNITRQLRPSSAFDVREIRVDCLTDGISTARQAYVLEYVFIRSRFMYVRCLAARDLVSALRQAGIPVAFRYDNMKLAGTSAAPDSISFEKSFQDEKHCHGDVCRPD
jgi:hypothetical protein